MQKMFLGNDIYRQRSFQQSSQMDTELGSVLPDPLNESQISQFLDDYVDRLLAPAAGVNIHTPQTQEMNNISNLNYQMQQVLNQESMGKENVQMQQHLNFETTPGSPNTMPNSSSQAVKEKNRRAQKRFRDRQKARMRGLESSVQDKTAQIESLQKQVQTLKSSNMMLQNRIKMQQEEIELLQESAKFFQQRTHSEHFQEETNGKRFGSQRELKWQRSLTDRESREASSQELILRWKTFVKNLSDLLTQIGQDGSKQETRNKVEEMMKEGRDMCLHTAITQPLRSKRLVMCNLEDIQNHGLNTQCCMQGGWESVLQALDLSPDQKATIFSLREEFMNRLMVLLTERQQINTRLRQAIPSKPELRFISLAGLQTADCLCDLKANLQKEHQAHLEFMASVLKDTLTLYQLATASVCSYPCFPDALAIANHLVTEENIKADVWQELSES
eukprot:TRINITY_DN7358_c1_g1_i1.p1 TRINITY_DN7358_c1_g1~~TRINITY_DN7358_c1_g1_i1.p1  ORF type:complete len:446 (-),score=41.22 TRINITY_DN7358_c1_g1_i1:216-1553(-)